MHPKDPEVRANSVDLITLPDLGLHHYFRPISPNTQNVYGEQRLSFRLKGRNSFDLWFYVTVNNYDLVKMVS